MKTPYSTVTKEKSLVDRTDKPENKMLPFHVIIPLDTKEIPRK